MRSYADLLTGPRLRLVLALLVAGGALMVFALLAEDLLTNDPIVEVDQRLETTLQDHRTAALTVASRIASTAGSELVLVPLAILLVAYLLWRRRPFDALLVAAASLGAELITVALKEVFARDRPLLPDPLAMESSASFPSGHASVSLALYGALALLLAEHTSNARRAAYAIVALALVVAIGFSRLYLGVHFLSDVLAGYSAGLFWLAICVATVRAAAARRASSGRCG